MASVRKAKRKPKGPLQAMIDREVVEQNSAPLVNAFAASHGNYQRNLRFVVNRYGSTVTRWATDGNLTDSQLAGILHCQNLWARLGSKSIIVNFDRVHGQSHSDGMMQHEALDELHRIAKEYPSPYWNVFERVCRFDEPAGTAGSRLSNHKRSAEIAARTIVAFIADMISFREKLSY